MARRKKPAAPQGQQPRSQEEINIDKQLNRLELVAKWAKNHRVDLDGELNSAVEKIRDHRAQLANEQSRNQTEDLSGRDVYQNQRTKNPVKVDKKPKRKVSNKIDSAVRPRKVKGVRKCDQCGKSHGENWEFKKKSRGTRVLCRFCKGPLDQKNYGKEDVLDRAWSGGAYGSNRRKF